MEDNTDRLGKWLIASAAEWQSEPLIHDFFQHLSIVENPREYLALFGQLMYLPVEKLEVVVQALAPQYENETYNTVD